MKRPRAFAGFVSIGVHSWFSSVWVRLRPLLSRTHGSAWGLSGFGIRVCFGFRISDFGFAAPARFALAVLGLLVLGGCGRPALPPNYEAVLREVTGVEFQLGSLTPDPAGTSLAFVHATEQGRGLSILELPTGRRTVLALTNEVIQVNGWSPDGRWLAFVQSAPARAGDDAGPRASWVTLWDAHTGTLRGLRDGVEVAPAASPERVSADRTAPAEMPVPLPEREGRAENYLFWLGTNTYFYASRELTQSAAGLFLGDLERGPGAKLGNYLPELAVMATNRAASGYRGEIVALTLQPLPLVDGQPRDAARVIEPLSDFRTNGFDAI